MDQTSENASNVNSSENSANSVVWQIEITPRPGTPDRFGIEAADNAAYLGIADLKIGSARGFLIQGDLDQTQIKAIADRLLVDSVVENHVITRADQPEGDADPNVSFVLPLPGVTDPEAESTRTAIAGLDFPVTAVRTFRKYTLTGIDADQRQLLCDKLLCNESIETIVHGQLNFDQIQLGQEYQFELRTIPIREIGDEALMEISREWQLSLTLVEMQTIQQRFIKLEREPTDIELETIAQTWSEHCSHKTLAGKIDYSDENGERKFDNMLKETIFAATQTIRANLGANDWCVSVFVDNAGIVKFDDLHNVAFKVETHNRPSALEPYGGANTGIGGVIRDTLGTGMGAKPVCNTDVFCFANPEMAQADLPPGVMHPRRIMKGVVSGVRDYGNRMGIPTVNGAVYFDDRYVGNPLVFCGNIGILPKEMSFKEPLPGDLIVSIGGKTGRDGIHGATFSSAELTESSEITSGGSVQIGNAITEKMLMDVMLEARDRNLYSAVTDCGAGGFSSAVGEMGEEIGAEVWLDKAPLKYDGLNYTEIWISEAQERMVFAVPESKWDEFRKLCESESVEATAIGRFVPTGNLELKYKDQTVGNLSMQFLHDGRPPVVRTATFTPAPVTEFRSESSDCEKLTADLAKILASPNVASKHWIIRQYDHEVQGGSVIRPLVGVMNDGPSDAAVVRPVLNSRRGLVVSCGMNPHFGDHDPYHMAMSAIDEAVRNCVAVGADPSQIAILDNFCWGYTDRPETLGTLVRAALGCQEYSIVLGTPFISGKDSLNNEFSYTNSSGGRETISIPSTLLISAMGQVADVSNCVTMDLKRAGNLLFQIGVTRNHLGGSHFALVNESTGGTVPTVNPQRAKSTFAAVHAAIHAGVIRSCHDLSEGGLAASAAEMAFAGGLGASIDVAKLEIEGQNEGAGGLGDQAGVVKLYSESNTRFLVEVTPENEPAFVDAMDGIACCKLGQVVEASRLTINDGDMKLVDSELDPLKAAWLGTLDF